MIIAVNISRALAEGKTPHEATERAWDLIADNCSEHEYVIGVSKGTIISCFVLISVEQYEEYPDRVKFDLKPCSPQEEETINNYILDNQVNLSYIQKGKYIN